MIEVEHLVKDFGSVRAVDDISFGVPKGQVLGFLGPNGAGKSTTMKMLTGFIEASQGTARIGGLDVLQNPVEVKKLFGYLPESAPSYGEMLVSEFLEFIAEIRGFQGTDKGKACQRMREVCSLQDAWDRPIETLSKGFRQRVGFAQALIHDPQVLILDEPTDGLDPNQKFEVRRLIREMGRDKTIILSTHILEEVDAVCERVVIIAQGKLVVDSTPEKLKAQSSLHNAVTIRLAPTEIDSAKGSLGDLGVVSRVEVLEDARPSLRVYPRNGAPIVNEVAKLAREKNWRMEQLNVESGRLDEVFRKMTIEQQGGMG